MNDLRVSALSMTPVKGLALHHPHHLDVTAGGVAGDRAFFLATPEGGVISCTDLGGLMSHRADYDPMSRLLTVHGPEGVIRSAVVELGEPLVTDFFGLRDVSGHVALGWESLFSQIAGRPVRLVLGDSGGYDVARLTLLGASSTDALASRNGSGPVDARRFRMNVEVSGAAPHDEDTWEGSDLRIGEAVLRVGGPVKRCAATTRNPDSGAVDLQTLRMIGAARGRQETPEWGKGFYFGVYAEVLVPGRIHVGDTVALADDPRASVRGTV